MRPVATDVALSVFCVSVGHTYMSRAKTAEPTEMPFGGGLTDGGPIKGTMH